MASPQDKEEVLLSLSLKWSEADPPKNPLKLKRRLESPLQTWFNKQKKMVDCSVEHTLRDGTVAVKFSPPPALVDLQKLSGQTLTRKDGVTVTILSIRLTSPGLEIEISDDVSMNPRPSVPEPQADKVQLEKQSDPVSSAGSTSVEEHKKVPDDCLVPVSLFWYVHQIYKEEMKHIERKHKVKIEPNVSVKFRADQEDGNTDEAISEFTNLIQKCLADGPCSVIPLKFVDPDQWSDALRIIQKNEKKLLLSLSSEEIIVWGPSQSQQAFSASLNAMQSASLSKYEPAPQNTSQKIDMTIKDPLVDAGLTIKENIWKQMALSFPEERAKIKSKFNVDFKESSLSQGKVSVKATYLRPAGNASMESHAVRALLNLYQKTGTSPLSFIQPSGATGSSGSQKNFTNGYQSEEASSGPALNGQSSQHHPEAPAGRGAAAGGTEEENCPICLSPFTKKQQLKCKHEFCKECLKKAVKHSGPICPICKDVFGVIEGDQPKGKMSYVKGFSPLPGFSDCGHILITYEIRGGVQTKEHPNPGKHYSGIARSAYLPDNKEGNEVLRLLQKAFDQRLIFTVGTSRTTGAENQVTWNDIHHKTSISGGPQSFGYPDPNYLKRVKEELKAKGIK
ncbi:uncharacterized protein PAE49_002831 [Odontesthes bonariensis]|uniref:uncharacterized protein LOC142377089 n=1 Tax=Odontesthes bonariensis TaxID=219752 RepID=UPI003F5875C7